ncbi:MAG: hypothetical protein ACREJ6_00170, partial [Candidatus Methylomirabilis sp.]
MTTILRAQPFQPRPEPGSTIEAVGARVTRPCGGAPLVCRGPVAPLDATGDATRALHPLQRTSNGYPTASGCRTRPERIGEPGVPIALAMLMGHGDGGSRSRAAARYSSAA